MEHHIILSFLSNYRLPLTITNYQTSMGEVSGYNSSEPAVKYVIKSIKDKAVLEKIFVFTSRAINSNIDKKNPESLSHYSLFKKHIQAEFNFFSDSSFENSDFNEIENADDNEYDAFSELAVSAKNMADKIMAFKQRAGGEIVIHVDLTGGFRIAAFLISTVVQLLEHKEGITIEDYIYSQFKPNRIMDASEIVQSSSLAAGAEAFMQYGSATVLRNYIYEHKGTSSSLKKLADSMDNFSESLMLCRAGTLHTTAKRLKDSIADFEKSEKDNAYDKLFSVFLDEIKEKYTTVISYEDEKDYRSRLNIIKWCAENNYLQQAMTFYTEWIPTIIVQIGICKPNNEIKEECIKKTQDYVPWEKYMITEYVPKYKISNNDSNPEFCDLIKKYYSSNRTEEIISIKQNLKNLLDGIGKDCYFMLEKILSEIAENDKIREEIKKGIYHWDNLIHNLKKYLYSLIEYCNSLEFNSKGNLKKNWRSKFTYAFIRDQIKKMPDDKIHQLFFKPLIANISDDKKSAQSDLRKILPKLIKLGFISTKLLENLDKAVDICCSYIDLKDMRNNINHAGAEDTYNITSAALQKRILEELEKIQKVINKQ